MSLTQRGSTVLEGAVGRVTDPAYIDLDNLAHQTVLSARNSNYPYSFFKLARDPYLVRRLNE